MIISKCVLTIDIIYESFVIRDEKNNKLNRHVEKLKIRIAS